MRDGLVEAGWRAVELLERLDHGPSMRALAEQLSAEAAHAAATLVPLARWQGLGESSYRTYLGGPNQVRIRRVLDLVQAGDRVVDVGIGFGYLTAVLVRSGLLAHYCGIDIEDRYVRSARQALQAHGLAQEDVQLEVRSLYDVTPGWMAAHRPTLVTLLEVLEHVPDAEGALRVLADAVEPGTAIVFTVPMLRRLEGVWGHASVFDRGRIEDLCDAAGLTLQLVEPIHNTWALVMATREPGVSPRLLHVLRASSPRAEPAARGYRFEDVPPQAADPRARSRAATIALEPSGDGLRCTVTATRPWRLRRAAIGGVGLPVRAPEILRLQVAYDDADAIAAVRLEALAAGGERVGSWKWALTSRNRPGDKPITHVIRDTSSGRFTRIGPAQLERAERIELSIALRARSRHAAVRLLRAAYLPGAAAADKAAPPR
jgi:SAM-dependent methyltransferase